MKITNRIPFTLADYESGKYKVVTRVGKRARIVCTDMKSLYNKPIIAIYLLQLKFLLIAIWFGIVLRYYFKNRRLTT